MQNMPVVIVKVLQQRSQWSALAVDDRTAAELGDCVAAVRPMAFAAMPASATGSWCQSAMGRAVSETAQRSFYYCRNGVRELP